SVAEQVTRVVFDLAQPADFHVGKVGAKLQVSFGETAKIAAVDSVAAGFSRPEPAPVPAEAGTHTEAPKPAPSVDAVPVVADNAATWKMPEKPADKPATKPAAKPVATARITAQAAQTPPAPAPRRKGRNLNAPQTAAPAAAAAPAGEDVFNNPEQLVVGSTPQPVTPVVSGALSGRTLSATEKV